MTAYYSITTWFLSQWFAQYVLVAVAAGLFFLLLLAVKQLISMQLRRFAARSNSPFDESLVAALERVGWPFYLVLPIYLSSRLIDLPLFLNQVINGLTLVVTVFYAVLIVQFIIVFALKRLFQIQTTRGEAVDQTISGILLFATRLVLWSTAAIMLLQNLGFNVSALLGGVGIAGIAISFALKNILEDIFSFFTIYFDKPFAVGDFIDIGEESGTVEKIGLKSTRIRTLQGQELVVSNSELTTERIHNYRRLQKRRIVMRFGLSQDTPTKTLEKIPDAVAKICDSIDQIELSRVHLKELGSVSLIYEVVYFVLTNEYSIYMDAQQTINLQLLSMFEKHKIQMAGMPQPIVPR